MVRNSTSLFIILVTSYLGVNFTSAVDIVGYWGGNLWLRVKRISPHIEVFLSFGLMLVSCQRRMLTLPLFLPTLLYLLYLVVGRVVMDKLSFMSPLVNGQIFVLI